jgi:hypothetical protein
VTSLLPVDREIHGRRYDILHFYMNLIESYGGRPQGDEQVLVLEDANGDPASFDTTIFSRLFEGVKGASLRLVIFNSNSTRSPPRDFRLASKLIDAALSRIHTVIVMQDGSLSDANDLFVVELYKQLANGSSIDHAVQRGREILSANVTNLYFLLPVIFMEHEDGYIFRRSISPNKRKGKATKLDYNTYLKSCCVLNVFDSHLF